MINWKLLKIFCLVLGVLSLIMAFSVMDGSVGYYETSEKYGGDAYTGIQNAAAQTANNILYLGKTIRTALTSFLAIQGLAMILGGLCIRTKVKTAPQQPVVVAQPVAPQQPVEAAQPVEVAQPVVAPQPQSSVWHCQNCGKVNAENHRICLNCGAVRG